MELSDTDWGILTLCHDNRQTRKNIAVALDKTPNYISKELSELGNMGLLEQPGPAENSGMYATTQKGSFVIAKQDKYDRRQSELFGELVESAMSLSEQLSEETETELSPNKIVLTTFEAYDLLQHLEDISKISAQKAADLVDMNRYMTQGLLYELYFFDLLDRANTSTGEIYDLTSDARLLLDHPTKTSVEDVNRAWNTMISRDRSDTSPHEQPE